MPRDWPRRVASTQLVSPNSSGWPIPRSLASERAAMTSARRSAKEEDFGCMVVWDGARTSSELLPLGCHTAATSHDAAAPPAWHKNRGQIIAAPQAMFNPGGL